MSSASTPLMPRTPPEPVSAADGGDNDTVKIVAATAVESELRSAGLEIFGDASAVGGSAGEDAVTYGSNNIIREKNNNHHEDDVQEKDNVLDSLLFAAALASGPHFTRHHYHHTFHPNLSPLSISPALSSRSGTPSLSPTSSVSSGLFGLDDEYNAVETPTVARPAAKNNDVTVKCMVRTRVPTPHGEVFLHLYHNNRDDKEHLAIVIDPAQLDYDGSKQPAARFIRSKSLDAVWHEDETPMERITRGAYVGRLSEDGYTVSSPDVMERTSPNHSAVPAPLVRIHSECFTGETIGSMRCDCGEQLDEAMRRIAEPITFNDPDTKTARTIPGRGAVIYMRQEGRGIGLLAKLRAYNLQDLGHDTVQANLLLGHGADERGYDVAAAIVRDLGLDDDEEGGIRLLTNNPDKVQKLTDEGVHVLERVPMVPRTWRCQDESEAVKVAVDLESKLDIHDLDAGSDAAARLRSAGATLIGASATRGPELEKYLRTKVLRMGHMLSLPSI